MSNAPGRRQCRIDASHFVAALLPHLKAPDGVHPWPWIYVLIQDHAQFLETGKLPSWAAPAPPATAAEIADVMEGPLHP